jgi:hypothetical protein
MLTMRKTTYRTHYSTTCAKLYLAFELGNQEWKLGFPAGLGRSLRRRTIDAGELGALVMMRWWVQEPRWVRRAVATADPI